MVPQRAANSRRTSGICLSVRLQRLVQRTGSGICGVSGLSELETSTAARTRFVADVSTLWDVRVPASIADFRHANPTSHDDCEHGSRKQDHETSVTLGESEQETGEKNGRCNDTPNHEQSSFMFRSHMRTAKRVVCPVCFSAI